MDDPGFSRGDANPRGRGPANLMFGIICAENCVEMKEIRLRGVEKEASLAPLPFKQLISEEPWTEKCVSIWPMVPLQSLVWDHHSTIVQYLS